MVFAGDVFLANRTRQDVEEIAQNWKNNLSYSYHLENKWEEN